MSPSADEAGLRSVSEDSVIAQLGGSGWRIRRGIAERVEEEKTKGAKEADRKAEVVTEGEDERSSPAREERSGV
jgi:hypothetical protein